METTATEFTITKSTIQSYKIRHSSGMYWADISIDENEKGGRIQIASDYGDYQYFWGSAGPLKQFLITLGKDYAAAKFGASKHFYLDETIESYKKAVISSRKNLQIEEMEARVLWDEIKEIEDTTSEKSDFVFEVRSRPLLMNFFEYSPDMVTGISPQLNKFWDGPWKAFIEELKNEKQIPAPLCEHANEVPAKCNCPQNCYCKSHTCKNKKS